MFKPLLRRKRKTIFEKLRESYHYLKLSWSIQTKCFFENSTLHGVKYISATNRPFIERFMWFVCITTGTIATFVVIFSLWDKFQTNPTITGLDTDFHNWNVPFPAVVLCPHEPASFGRIRNYLGLTSNISYEDQEKVQFLHDISRLSINTLTEFNTKYRNGIPQFFNTSQDLRKLVFKLISNCADILDNCTFKGIPVKCCGSGTKSFNPLLTEIGICYGFNSKYVEQRMLGDVQFNMQYIKETDIKWSLGFSVKSEEALTSIYIEHPDEMIGIDTQPKHVWDFSIASISVAVKSTYTTDSTRQLSMKQRKCVFQGEIKLKVSFGGIAGLFVGFSLLSAIEIVYFFVLRTSMSAFGERNYLDKVSKENNKKTEPSYDLSLIPYFISQPLPGHGMDLIVKKFDNKKNNGKKPRKFRKTNKIHVMMIPPPFGIEFVN